ncbi:hypothetical protein [Rivibacter subsaxonicus]|uniref:DUF4136 domain-containing protein n=1 Tax=Rivibacter subsaxonicus TaxID=457575 RepID=A0A4Q7VG31_9BURK|nr:hypothetical protein [Rivibacter subsaxonicus]RZT94961.1 hypothetical protein EV670_2707 [Rivibacter subsaxonicus]
MRMITPIFGWLMPGAAATSLALLAGCASGPTLNSSWRDPEFKGPPLQKVLVIGVSRSETQRRIFEDGFAQGLRKAGSNGVASHPLLPESGVIPDARIQEAVKQAGADAVMTTRVLSREQRINVVPGAPMMGPPMGRGFHGWYGSAWMMAPPPDVIQYDVVTIETTLWDVKRDRVVWTATTQTTRVDNLPGQTEQLAALLVPKMKADGVL